VGQFISTAILVRNWRVTDNFTIPLNTIFRRKKCALLYFGHCQLSASSFENDVSRFETHAMTEHEQWNPLWFHPCPVWILAVLGLDFGVIDGGKSLPDARRDMPIVQLHMINVEELMRLGLE
jgi:hypothetical protein